MNTDSQPASSSRAGDASRHIVQFYEDDEYLCEVLADYLLAGISAREPLIVFATEAHRRVLTALLSAKQCDVRQAVVTGQLSLLDAQETLDQIMCRGYVDHGLFVAQVSELVRVRQAQYPGKYVRFCGELVDLLWSEGNPQASLALEQTWNALGQSHAFTCLCSYRLRAHDDHEAVRLVRHLHSHVLPSQHCSSAAPLEERLRHLFMLEQAVRTLESDCAAQKLVERSLRAALHSYDGLLMSANQALRTPLMVLKLQVDALRHSGAGLDASELQEHLTELDRQIERLVIGVDESLAPRESPLRSGSRPPSAS